MSDIRLIPATEQDIQTLANLFQLYDYDFWEMLPDDPDSAIGEDGLFDHEFDLDEYFHRAGYHCYLARVDGKLAGFAFTSEKIAHGQGAGRFVEEFFVLRPYRGKGVGRALAFQLFDTFRGYWEVTELPENASGIAFWQSAIEAYTDGRFIEFWDDEDGILYPWQTFDSSTF